jgi:hypothetical protein
MRPRSPPKWMSYQLLPSRSQLEPKTIGNRRHRSPLTTWRKGSERRIVKQKRMNRMSRLGTASQSIMLIFRSER